MSVITLSSATAHAIYNSLRERYQKETISKKETAKEIGVGLSTISRMMAEGIGIPNYKKIGSAKNSRVVFPIVDVAEFLADTIEVA